MPLYTFQFPTNPSRTDNFLNIVLAALEQTGMVPKRRPDTGLPRYMNRDNLKGLVCEQANDLWSYTILFGKVPAAAPNCIGMEDNTGCATALEAFYLGSLKICEIVTGKSELPFYPVENTLVLVSDGQVVRKTSKAGSLGIR